jgi:heme A synthase
MMEKLFLPLMGVGLISPVVAIMAAFILFIRHRARVEPEGRVPAIGYVLAVIVSGAIGGCFGLLFGLDQACPRLGNLCGLWPVFVTGPICLALAILLVGIMVSLIRPAPRSADRSSN